MTAFHIKYFRASLLALALFAAPLPAATVDGIPLHYTVTGKGPATVIFVHGWTCDESSWSEQVPAVAVRYRVVTVDLPGHGRSGSPRDGKFSMDLFARAVEAVRAEVAAERVVLVGHSMGTPVIVQYTRLYPQHTAALVFAEGVVTLGANLGHKPNTDRMKGPEGLKNREANTRGMFSAATTPELQSKILKMMLGAPDVTAAGAMEAMFDPGIWKNDTIALPILALYADKSGLASRAFMKEHYPNLEYTEIPGTGHFLMLEKPAEFNRLLLAFLDKRNF
jgi:pimeloyl-ACP methyl ester carboxylesterase